MVGSRGSTPTGRFTYTTYRLPTGILTVVSTKSHTSWLRNSFSWHEVADICCLRQKTLFSILFTTSPLAKSWIRACYVYSKQPIFGLTQEWLRELSFSRLECGVHDRLHIYPLCGIIAPLRHGHVYILLFFVIGLLAEPYIGITPYCNQVIFLTEPSKTSEQAYRQAEEESKWPSGLTCITSGKSFAETEAYRLIVVSYVFWTCIHVNPPSFVRRLRHFGIAENLRPGDANLRHLTVTSR